MDRETISKLVNELMNGNIKKEDFVNNLTKIYSDEFKFDTNRKKRLGFDEFIFGESKNIEQLIDIIKSLKQNKLSFVCTKLSREKLDFLSNEFSDLEVFYDAGIIRYLLNPPSQQKGKVAVITAGSSDLPIAKEALITLDSCGVESRIYADVGVAGVHRFFKIKDELEEYDVLIVIAGMEGALPSLVAGLFPQPIIAVPTSVGYGTALKGFTPLFAMLTSCANGVSVVNIDNGFGAAMAAFRILNSKYKGDNNV